AYVQPAFTDLSGSLAATQMPALMGDVTSTAGTTTTTLAASIGGTPTFRGNVTFGNTITGNISGSAATAGTISGSINGTQVSGNISGSATNVTGTVAVANGGTGAATFAAHSFFGNNTAATVVPALVLIGASDVSPQWYATGGGSAQVQTVTLTPAATALAAGLEVFWKPLAANTGAAPTLNVNGFGPKPITKLGTAALVANDLPTTAIADAIYDGTEWQ